MNRFLGIVAAGIIALGSTALADDLNNVGKPPTNAADRQAIQDVIGSYSYLLDNNLMDAWLGLFTNDTVLEFRNPGHSPIVLNTVAQVSAAVKPRFAGFAKSGIVRRHLMAGIAFVEQTDSNAHIFVEVLITNVHDGKTFSPVSSGQYEGWLVKVEGVWKIKRWIDAPDAIVQ
jgi:hypothetical protein